MDSYTAADTNWVSSWNDYFSQHWERNQGPDQTAFFARVTLAGLPGPFWDLVRQAQLEILDWGCAMGDALPVFAQAFPNSELSGIDLSPLAIQRAQAHYPQFLFSTQPLLDLVIKRGQRFSIVYTSNCLEHFAHPIEILSEQILPGVKDYLIILVPYQEQTLCEGHLVRFEAQDFPAQLHGLERIFWRVIPTTQLPGSFWQGQQILLIYARPQAIGLHQLRQGLSTWHPLKGPHGSL